MSTEDTDLLEDDDFTDEEPEPQAPQQDTDLIRRLRKQAEKGTAYKRQVSELRTELAIRDAGLTLTPEQRKAVLAVHEGPTTAEAIAETASKLGWAPPSPAETPEANAEKNIDAATNAASALLGGGVLGAEWTSREAQTKYEQGEIDYPTYMEWMKQRHGAKSS